MSQVPSYPIRLEHIFFTRTSVSSVPNYDPAKMVPAKPENNINVEPVPEAENTFRAAMRTTLNAEQAVTCPYVIDIECFATLVTDGTLSAEEALRGVTINAHGVLYGAIRETVAWITGRHPYGPLVLGLSVLQGGKPKPTGGDPTP